MPRDPYMANALPEGEEVDRPTVFRGQKGIWIRDLKPGTFRFVPGGHKAETAR